MADSVPEKEFQECLNKAGVRAAAENGADLIELGIPFSDPTAEGPVIQGANLRALNTGITTDKIFAFDKIGVKYTI